ncbi:MAG TPA: ornithine carbamoyltransferase [Candidatus Anoxymicrobiaceae bacterium]
MLKNKLRGADFLTLAPLSGDEIESLLEEAVRLKSEGTRGYKPLAGKVVGLIFEKPSTRTRVSFEVAVHRLAGSALALTDRDLQLGRGETIEDTGRVLSRYLDGLVVRTFGQERLESLAQASSVPVINALTDQSHPCQALADMMTVLEYKGAFRGLKLAYLGDGNNVAHSLMRAGTKLGMSIAVATPEGHGPLQAVTTECAAYADASGGSLVVGNDPAEASGAADVIYTDVWVSMGQPDEKRDALSHFAPFQVNEEMLARASEDVMVMHCLPAHRGEEISGEVLDGSHSAVWDQAENRLHAQVALLGMILG